MDAVEAMARRLRDDPLTDWLDAEPFPMAVVNRHRQILFSNKAFCAVACKTECADVVGLRPGEALDCIHSHVMKAGCGCSEFCSVCGAAIAILKSLEGEEDCRECRMIRMDNGAEVPLDLQIFTRPVDFQGESLTLIHALDISHEKRLAYLNRAFHHNLVNGVGGISVLADLLESEQDSQALLELLGEAARRTLGKVLYHRDVDAAEKGRLSVTMEAIDAGEFLSGLVREECLLRNTRSNCVTVSNACTTLHSDRRILGHVLSNMLENALEAREKARGDIRLSCEPGDDGGAVITMRNPGEVPADIRKQMFKRYVSSKSRDRGLGAYVMKLFTERYLGGTVSFVSEDGETAFRVVLPAGGE